MDFIYGAAGLESNLVIKEEILHYYKHYNAITITDSEMQHFVVQ